MNLKDLSKPFPYEDIEWRISRSGIRGGKPWGKVLAYVTARAIQDRLDSICGPENWQNEFKEGPQGGVLCGLSIFVNEKWVTKWNGADNTNIEAVKGGLSDATKRAGVEWGIGRYLYNLEEGWADFDTNGLHSTKIKDGGKDTWFKWNSPPLPEWALPENSKPPPAPQSSPKPKAKNIKEEYEEEKERVIEESSNRDDPELPKNPKDKAQPQESNTGTELKDIVKMVNEAGDAIPNKDKGGIILSARNCQGNSIKLGELKDELQRSYGI